VDPLQNPYSMSAGNPPAALTGREEQTEQLRRLLALGARASPIGRPLYT